jgi:hypothetical protein
MASLSTHRQEKFFFCGTVKLTVMFDAEPLDRSVFNPQVCRVCRYVEFQALIPESNFLDLYSYDWKKRTSALWRNDARVFAFIQKHWQQIARPLRADTEVRLLKPVYLGSYVKLFNVRVVDIPADLLPATLNDVDFATKYGLEGYRADMPLLVLHNVAYERTSVDESAVARRRKRLQDIANRGEDDSEDALSDDNTGHDAESEPCTKKSKQTFVV